MDFVCVLTNLCIKFDYIRLGTTLILLSTKLKLFPFNCFSGTCVYIV